jgi:glucose-1-phosphate thymidylyltransferase
MVQKAVVMAGGYAKRLRPLTTATNKHMLPVYDKPMIQRVIETIVASGVTDILVLLTHSYAQPVMELLEHGDALGCSIHYEYEREASDVGNRIMCAKRFIGGEPFLLMLGDSYYAKPLNLERLQYPHMWVMPLGPAFDDFRKYAEVELSPDKKQVIAITEKPTKQKSGIIQTGAWVFGSDVCDLAARMRRSEGVPNEVQVRTIVNHYLAHNKMWATMLPPRSFLDLGTPDALLQAGILAKEEAHARRLTAAE